MQLGTELHGLSPLHVRVVNDRQSSRPCLDVVVLSVGWITVLKHLVSRASSDHAIDADEGERRWYGWRTLVLRNTSSPKTHPATLAFHVHLRPSQSGLESGHERNQLHHPNGPGGQGIFLRTRRSGRVMHTCSSKKKTHVFLKMEKPVP